MMDSFARTCSGCMDSEVVGKGMEGAREEQGWLVGIVMGQGGGGGKKDKNKSDCDREEHEGNLDSLWTARTPVTMGTT